VKKMIKYKGTMEVIQDGKNRIFKFEINKKRFLTEDELEDFERDFKNDFIKTHNGNIEIINFFIGVDEK
jgi:hypothetical protein